MTPPGSAGRVRRRTARRRRIVGAALGTVLIGLSLLALMLGDYVLSPRAVVDALTGQSTGIAATVVVEWRLPRLVAALAFGAALAVSGALFQTVTANSLGSPDILGIASGAYTGALIAIIVLGGGFLVTATSALIGAIVVTLLILALSRGRGTTSSLRFVLVGVAVMLFLTALNTAVVHRADRVAALAAASWGAGSLGSVLWDVLLPAGLALGVLLAVGAFSARDLDQIQLGRDIARSTGVDTKRSWLILLGCGAAATAVVTALTGPIAFVSLAAPPIARRLGPWTPAPLWMIAGVGAALLLAADLIAQHLFSPTRLPVGVVTACLGGGYLLWLISREVRRT